MSWCHEVNERTSRLIDELLMGNEIAWNIAQICRRAGMEFTVYLFSNLVVDGMLSVRSGKTDACADGTYNFCSFW